METNDQVTNPFVNSSESEEDEKFKRPRKMSNNRGYATRINMPYIPPIFHKITKVDDEPTGHSGIRGPGSSVTAQLDPSYPSIVRHICYVCRRRFRDYDHLKRHERISYMHRNNLA